jgi:hypothetical protein
MMHEPGGKQTVSPAKTTAAAPAIPARRPRRGIERSKRPGVSKTPTVAAEVVDRDQMLDRLQHLRTILPVFAQELATARRHAAQLRKDNRRLLEEVHRLQRERGTRGSAL